MKKIKKKKRVSRLNVGDEVWLSMEEAQANGVDDFGGVGVIIGRVRSGRYVSYVVQFRHEWGAFNSKDIVT